MGSLGDDAAESGGGCDGIVNDGARGIRVLIILVPQCSADVKLLCELPLKLRVSPHARLFVTVGITWEESIAMERSGRVLSVMIVTVMTITGMVTRVMVMIVTVITVIVMTVIMMTATVRTRRKLYSVFLIQSAASLKDTSGACMRRAEVQKCKSSDEWYFLTFSRHTRTQSTNNFARHGCLRE